MNPESLAAVQAIPGAAMLLLAAVFAALWGVLLVATGRAILGKKVAPDQSAEGPGPAA